MSAYIVNKEHVVYLVQAAMSRMVNKWGPFRWDGKALATHEWETAAEAGNMLWRENVKSVSYRYPKESSATLPGPVGGPFVVTPDDFRPLFWDCFDPIQVLKACDCFEYQSCEHPEWEESEAAEFIRVLRNHAWHSLPGYDKAEWGAPKTLAEKRAEYRATFHASFK